MIKGMYGMLRLKYGIWKTNVQIRGVDNQIYNHDGAIPEFEPVSKEFSLRLGFRRASLAIRRENLLYQRNSLEFELSSLN